MRKNMNNHVLAIDIGGSKYMVGIVDQQGNIAGAVRHTWDDLTSRDVIDRVIDSARKLIEDHKDISLESIGVTIPGLAHPGKGIWVESSFSGIKNIGIGGILQKEFNIPVYIDNDAQACALAEKLFGVCRTTKNYLYITVSNGIGGAVFVNDTLYYGAFGNAGEIGHCIAVEDGFQCNCGNKGCLEMHAAGPAIVRTYLQLGGNNEIGDKKDAKYISELAQAGDETAIRTFQMTGYYIGKVIGTISNVINPERVIIGGGVSLSFPLFEKTLGETVRKFIYYSANKDLEILPSKFGYKGGLFGAAAVAFCGKDNKYNWGIII